MSQRSRTLTFVGVLVVLAVAAILLYAVDDVRLGLLAVPAALLVAAAHLGLEEVRWRELGMQRPRRWWLAWVQGAALAVATLVLVALGGPHVEEHLGRVDLSEFDDVPGNPVRLLFWLAVAWTVAAFGEELLLRGYLFSRLTFVFGGTTLARVLAVLATAVVQGLGHAYQGPTGMVLTGGIGLLFCLGFLATGRNLWVVILAHGLFDTVSFVLLYSR